MGQPTGFPRPDRNPIELQGGKKPRRKNIFCMQLFKFENFFFALLAANTICSFPVIFVFQVGGNDGSRFGCPLSSLQQIRRGGIKEETRKNINQS